MNKQEEINLKHIILEYVQGISSLSVIIVNYVIPNLVYIVSSPKNQILGFSTSFNIYLSIETAILGALSYAFQLDANPSVEIYKDAKGQWKFTNLLQVLDHKTIVNPVIIIERPADLSFKCNVDSILKKYIFLNGYFYTIAPSVSIPTLTETDKFKKYRGFDHISLYAQWKLAWKFLLGRVRTHNCQCLGRRGGHIVAKRFVYYTDREKKTYSIQYTPCLVCGNFLGGLTEYPIKNVTPYRGDEFVKHHNIIWRISENTTHWQFDANKFYISERSK